MSATIRNNVSSHKLGTSGLPQVPKDLDKESEHASAPTIISPDTNGLLNVVPNLIFIVDDRADPITWERFTLNDSTPTISEFREGVESLGKTAPIHAGVARSILIGHVDDDGEAVDKLIESDDSYRHWSPQSQRFAPADILLQYLQDGWNINNRIVAEVFHCPSRQCAELYYFMLLHNSEYITIPVIANPLVLRLVREFGLTVIRVYDDCEDSYPS
ncbi:MAG: hypothetical protein R3E39_01155 [Anaerolineae bacterium]